LLVQPLPWYVRLAPERVLLLSDRPVVNPEAIGHRV
jgi:hypothetical protein